MKKYTLLILILGFQPTVSFLNLARAESDQVPNAMRLDHVPVQGDTAIIIKKNPKEGIDRPDFEIVSGDAEVLGDPESGNKAGYASWKKACDDWKKETRELNKDNQVLVMNCGSPSFTQEGGVYTYKSQGTYKLKVKMKIRSEAK